MAGFLDALRAFFTPPVTVQRGLTADQLFGSSWEPHGSTAGVAVTTESALRNIAVQAALRLLTNDIGSLPVDAFRAQENGKKELRKPGWVVTPNPNNPNETWEDHVKQVVYAALTDGNDFTYVYPSVFDAQGLSVLDPKDVTIKGSGPLSETTYDVKGLGRELTPANIIHIPWMVPAGKKRGLNPIEAAKQGLGIALASDEFVGAYFGNGAILSGVIKFPPGVEPTPEQVAQIKKDFARKHVGAQKSHAVGALTGGAEYEPFDYNNRDAQLLELRDQIVEEVARLFGIPPHMLGSQKPGAVGYASVEQRSIDYVTHAVLPIVRRIEVGYSRLLRGSQTYLRFNLEGLKRGDQAARATFYQAMLANKVIKREEVRALEELPWDGELGYLETPNNNPPDNTPSEPVRGLTLDIAEATFRDTTQVVTVSAPVVIPPEPPTVRVAAPDMSPVASAVTALRDDISSLRADIRKPRTRRLLTDGDGNVVGSEEVMI